MAALRRALTRLAIGLSATGLLLGIWAFWYEPQSLVVRRTVLPLTCWTGSPLNIVLISDLHVGSPFVGTEKLEHVVTTANALNADVIVLLGDYVIQGVKGGKYVPPEKIAQSLKRLHAPLGVYAVLGNHDWWLAAARVERALQSAGINVVEDRAVKIRRGDDHFWLVGVSDYEEGPHDVKRALAGVTDSAPVIVITHNPDLFPIIPRRVCLTLAGHTHGGQVALPFIGRPIVPSHYGDDYAIGHIHELDRDLFVTSGIGTSIIPVRFRVPPEIVALQVVRR